jgi:C-terminal processing protease CtpA/Prc
MKTGKALFLLLLLPLIMLTSCIDFNNDGKKDSYQVNDWILDIMETYYLWNEKMPGKTDKELAPPDYFESLLYKEEDRFSWIQEDFTELMESLVGIDTEPGYDFNLYALDKETPVTVGGFITYVKPNSPAAATNLKRGHVFTEINDKAINGDNYRTLLNELSLPHTLTVIDPEEKTKQKISFALVRYEENPILLDTVYRLDARKIGYLVYNFFADDPGDGSQKYSLQLNRIFGKFKNEGINDLVLDLRYNSGGALSAATKISSMISNRSAKDIFLHYQYNSVLGAYYEKEDGEDYNKSYFEDKIGNEPINKLGLTRLYVLTSGRTASASEIVINGLKPYIDVILVGETTYGKPFGSVTIYEEDEEKQKTNKWGLQPIIVKFTNSRNQAEYLKGFNPDVESDETEELPFKQLGDINEKMLRDALEKTGVDLSQFENRNTLRSDKPLMEKPIWSSADRKPVRRTTYINNIKL